MDELINSNYYISKNATKLSWTSSSNACLKHFKEDVPTQEKSSGFTLLSWLEEKYLQARMPLMALKANDLCAAYIVCT